MAGLKARILTRLRKREETKNKKGESGLAATLLWLARSYFFNFPVNQSLLQLR